MDNHLMLEVLWAHADGLNRNHNGLDYLSMFPHYRDELAPLFELAARIKTVLIPLQANQAFRQGLHHDLLVAARHREEDERSMFRMPRWEWVIGAAAIGSAMSIAGMVAYIRHSRSEEETAHLAG